MDKLLTREKLSVGSIKHVEKPIAVGVYKKLSLFAIPLTIDENERLRSLDKAELRELAAGTTSPMPPASDVLDEQEVADVLAYLLSLKGLN